MSITSTEAYEATTACSADKKANVEKNNTSHKIVSGSLMQTQFSTALIKLEASYLDDCALGKFCETARFSRDVCQKDSNKRKQIRQELLPHVFGGAPDAIHKFFSTNTEPTLLLIKTGFREGYDSEKFNRFVCFRQWRGVSAVQAAARSGDQCLLLELLSRIYEVNDLRLDAIRQLKGVHQSISEQKSIVDVVTTILEAEDETSHMHADTVQRWEEIQASAAFRRQMKEVQNEMEAFKRQITNKSTKGQEKLKDSNQNNAADQKSAVEKKITIENAQNQYADDTEFLAPILKLLNAYIYFYDQFLQPQKFSYEEYSHFFDEANQVWEYIGECYRRLPHYVKQEFFDQKPFFPIPSFETSPNRGPLRLCNGNPISLDKFGIGTNYGVYKGRVGGVLLDKGASLWGPSSRMVYTWREDFAAVTHLYKLRCKGLREIINQLERPENSEYFKVRNK